MYTLVLTNNERQAVDWIGYRYSNGDDLYHLLMQCAFTGDWYSNEDEIHFYVPEHIAWQIAENARNEDGDSEFNFPCFSPELTAKLVDFCLNII